MDRKNTIFRHKLAGTWYRVVHCIWIFPFFKNQKIQKIQIAVNVKCDQPFLPFFPLYWLYIIWMYFYVRPYDKWGWFNNVTILSFIVRSINWISKTKQSSDIYFFSQHVHIWKEFSLLLAFNGLAKIITFGKKSTHLFATFKANLFGGFFGNG